jgi:nicotinamidase-related amidase
MKNKFLTVVMSGLLVSGIAWYAANTANAARDFKAPQIPIKDRVAALPVLTFSKSKIPTIAAHVEAAQSAGKPVTLTRVTDDATIKANRSAACGKFKPTAAETAKGFTSCDEYPFASSKEGGAGANVAGVPLAEQNSQGGTMSAFYRNNNIKDGDKFTVNVGP